MALRLACRRALCALALLLAACGSQQAAPTATPAPVTAAPPTSAPATAAPPTAAPSPAGGAATFANPVLRNDFPDPHVIEVDGVYFAYATNATGRNVQVARSEDLVRWELLRDALPSLPRWARPGGSLVWAPEVLQLGEQFVLYYTARDRASDRQCIGVARAGDPDGPFRDEGEAPLVCQAEEGGSIDPSPFRDADGALYLYWKNDGNCCSLPTYLYVQELSDDGMSLVGEPTRLVRNDRPWEGRVVEAPTMWLHDGGYYLFFSANDYAGFRYAVGYATCEAPLGPCTDAGENPLLTSDMEGRPPVLGPGHQTLLLDDQGQTWMFYHVWEVSPAGLRGTRRLLWLDQVVWEEGRPDVLGPTRDQQPAPAVDDGAQEVTESDDG